MKRKKSILLMVLMGMTSMFNYSQVGVGTTNPTAQLEIATTNSGFPALELNPQSMPVGSVTGQLAVIGDNLFMYDEVRAKWLSIESTSLQFGLAGSFDTQTLRFGGNMNKGEIGPLMPRNGTIIGITVTTYSNANKAFELRVRDYNSDTESRITTQSYSFSLTSNEFVNNTLNIDFNTNDFITLRGGAGGDATYVTAVIWIKWRE